MDQRRVVRARGRSFRVFLTQLLTIPVHNCEKSAVLLHRTMTKRPQVAEILAVIPVMCNAGHARLRWQAYAFVFSPGRRSASMAFEKFPANPSDTAHETCADLTDRSAQLRSRAGIIL